MSVQAMAWALEQKLIADPPARHVLLALANYADQAGRAAFPSVARLSAETGLSERTVQSKLRALERAGCIARGNQAVVSAHIVRADRRPNCFDISIWRGAAVAPREPDGVNVTTERGAPPAPDPSLTRIHPPYPARTAGSMTVDNKMTLAEALALWRGRGERAIGSGDRACRMGVPSEVLELQWGTFKHAHADGRERRTPDAWRTKFRSSVKTNAFGLWETYADGSKSASDKALALLRAASEGAEHAA